MSDYISREAAIVEIKAVYDWHDTVTVERLVEHMKKLPSANVVAADEVSDAVDEALRILDAINSSGRLDYGDYCDLHDVISLIGMEESE